MFIDNDILQHLRQSKKVIKAIAKATNTTVAQVEQWMQENNEQLSLAASVKVIKKYTGLTHEAILVYRRTKIKSIAA